MGSPAPLLPLASMVGVVVESSGFESPRSIENHIQLIRDSSGWDCGFLVIPKKYAILNVGCRILYLFPIPVHSHIFFVSKHKYLYLVELSRWWFSETVAVVTGANRGIGFEIARQLAGHGLTVILTARDTAVGLEAVKVLQEGGLNVDFHKLDVLDPASIKEFGEWIQQNYGGIDILVNNAGVNYNLGSDNSVEFAQMVLATNYHGTKNMIKAMIPLMRPTSAGARIVNVSSRLGRLYGRRNRIEDETLRQQLSNLDTLSEEHIDRMVSTFLQQVEDSTWTSGGWPQTFTDYSISKLGVNAYTRLMAKKLSDRPEGQKIYINSYCPGWVKTSMTGWSGNISAEDAADTGVWLALLPDQAISGKFFAERREISF